jgi:hypothetical protein
LQWSNAKQPKSELALKSIEVINAIKEDRMKKANHDRIEEIRKS